MPTGRRQHGSKARKTHLGPPHDAERDVAIVATAICGNRWSIDREVAAVNGGVRLGVRRYRSDRPGRRRCLPCRPRAASVSQGLDRRRGIGKSFQAGNEQQRSLHDPDVTVGLEVAAEILGDRTDLVEAGVLGQRMRLEAKRRGARHPRPSSRDRRGSSRPARPDRGSMPPRLGHRPFDNRRSRSHRARPRVPERPRLPSHWPTRDPG